MIKKMIKKKNQEFLKKVFFTSIFLSIILLFLSLNSLEKVYGSEEKRLNLTFSLHDIYTREEINSGIIEVIATKADSRNGELTEELSETKIFTLSNNNKINLLLEEDSWDFVITVDQVNTSGSDYYVTHRFEYKVDNKEQDIFLFPVASLRIRVEDVKGNFVNDAVVRIDCLGNRFLKPEIKTDLFGTGIIEFSPIGECSAYASFQDAAGVTNFNINQGENKNIVITLDKQVISKISRIRKTIMYSSFIILIIFLTYFFILRKIIRTVRQRKKSKKNKEENKNKIEIKHNILYDEDINNEIDINRLNNKTEDPVIPTNLRNILSTLNDREKEVIKYLVKNNYKEKQNILRYNLKIPKTSFSRIINSLEQKGIIEVDKENKPFYIKIREELLK